VTYRRATFVTTANQFTGHLQATSLNAAHRSGGFRGQWLQVG